MPRTGLSPMNDEIDAVLTELRAAAADRDADRVQDAIGQLEFFIVEDGGWHEDLFDVTRRLLADSGFLAVPTSYHLAKLLHDNWDELSPSQRLALRPILELAFDKFGDWMGAFILAEVLGERYADEAAFVTLDTLSSSAATAPARELAAYGLGRLARALKEGHVYMRTVERLEVLATSDTPEIRLEARDALNRLKNA